MVKNVKLADIAGIVGVSTVTVSKALSGQKGVSEEMREKIKDIADELGYKQPSVLRHEASYQKSYQIGILIENTYLDKYESFYWQMYQSVSTSLLAKECFAILEVVTTNSESEFELPKIIKEQKVHGIIVIGNMNSGYLNYLKRTSKLPFVYLDFYSEDKDVDSVVSDSFFGGYQMTKYLISMGHKKIAYVGTLNATGSINDRYFGYQKALLENNLAEEYCVQINDRELESGYISDEILKLPTKMPTAFFCNCDLTAGKLIKKLQTLGYRVPDDISVVGFDNYIFPDACNIGITTYEVDQVSMARAAVRLLLARISRSKEPYGNHVIGGRMIIKESVKKVK